MDKIDIRSFNLNEIQNFILQIGEKRFRAAQVYSWINNKLVTSFNEMTNLSKELRLELESKAYISKIIMLKKTISKDESRKYLFKLEGNSLVETVLMKQSYGNSICISTQVGCKMGCSFCASSLNGLERSLTCGEMTAQVYEVQKDIGERISHVVLMGMGEPFDNFKNIMKFINIINSKEGLDIGQRNITVSTSGLVERIYDFADADTQVNLAVSLHAPNDEIRQSIMKVAKRYSFDELLKACNYYTNKTKRRITYEYALISGINDSEENAKQLAKKIKGTLCHVNLIPVNNVEENNYLSSDKLSIQRFVHILKGFGIETTVRKKFGDDINAACGQLRKHYKNYVSETV